MTSKTCLVIDENVKYPTQAPYDPCENYVEFDDSPNVCVSNQVYGLVRDALLHLGLDKENIGKKAWSPFKDIVSPGDTVLIKPNMVIVPKNERAQNYVTTHASVIRPIIDYVWKALDGDGKIVVGDAPQAETDFDDVIRKNGIKGMIDELKHRGINVEYKDFRDLKVKMSDGVWVDEVPIAYHPGNKVINLGKNSMFYNPSEVKQIKYCGGGYNFEKTRKHHCGETQEYRVSKEVLDADVVISIPKMKTHKKAGITCCMKNLVGINVDKDYLPHYTMGDSHDGGDEMPTLVGARYWLIKIINFLKLNILYKHWKQIGKLVSKLLKYFDRKQKDDDELYAKNSAKNIFTRLSGNDIFQGAWSGNDTIWKMILDLNKIFLYVDKDGNLCDKPVRKVFYIVDGIICGAGDGPMEPQPVNAGLIVAGDNAFNIDMAILELFGIDSDKIPLYHHAVFEKHWLVPFECSKKEIIIKSNNGKFDKKLLAPTGWDF